MSSRSKNEDRLSSLPEEILSHILSLMPTSFAVRTSILSKRWKYSWTLVTNLDLNDYYLGFDFKCFSEFVDRVLEHCKTSQLQSFRLGLFRTSVQKSDVAKWINEAIRLNVSEVDIQVRKIGLPLSLFTCKTLTKLRLAGSTFDDSDVFNGQSPVVMLPGLETLDLNVSRISCVNLFRFIHGCPVLESLSLEILWPDDEVDYNFNIPTLKRLELRMSSLYTSKVVLNVPNLEYLCVGEDLCPHFVMKDLSSLVEAAVFFNGGLIDYRQKVELLKGLSGVKSLSLFTSTFNEFVHSHLPKFLNLKHLELKDSFKSPWILVSQILESSPELEHLCFEEPEDSSWIEPQSVPTCLVSNLKTMKITKCKGRSCDIQFLKYILGNAEVLKTITIIRGSLRMKDEMEMCARLLKFPRASRFCEIHFVGKWLYSSTGN
ncbi:unnamed protein product [Lactuca virosa]|uniref:F-box domain-containing protein n=1 Tax=Lactuca virosa TaxID=75947 RepID=A0AAU9LPV9_9ASTR|nr:unnamed protein product [Lactuca virosa]